tara:strand:- start:6662 stop:8218 length:1557 start_codon:yes stop_codon:yes gene_type:complete
MNKILSLTSRLSSTRVSSSLFSASALSASLLAVSLLVAPACSSDDATDARQEVDCSDGQCDTPGSAAGAECAAAFPGDRDAQAECREDKAYGHCEARRADALESSQQAFVKDAIRWAAADVEGVNQNGRDDRGQEYTEYFAVVVPPPETEGEAAPNRALLGLNQDGGGTSSSTLDLTEGQIFALEDEPDAIVGQCVFTSWHNDISEPMAVCNGSDSGCPELAFPEGSAVASWVTGTTGMKMNSRNLKMKVSFNSNGAAADLAERCMTEPLSGDAENPDDPLHDNYTRGCMKAFELFQTEWRRSDSAVCVAGGRMTQCGCGVDTDADGIADITDPKEISRILIPRQPLQSGETTLRGFPLGTWTGAGELPAGCNYANTGDDGQTLVTCDLTGNDVLAGAADVKERCRAKYGNNVVVHVPIPSAAIVCETPADGQYSETCGDTPWVVTAENSGANGGGNPTNPEPASCAHDVCEEGGNLNAADCSDTCVATVCEADDYCCSTAWDGICVGKAEELCSKTC